MDTQTYIAAVRGMVGLRPDMIEHLVALAPKLSDAQRKKAIADLTPLHAKIIASSEELLTEMSAGEKEIAKEEKSLRAAVEKDERASAESVFDDDSSQPV